MRVLSLQQIYYITKPFVPDPLLLQLRRWRARLLERWHRHDWPACPGTEKKPHGWCGWPHAKRFALVLTHDVEGPKGLERCREMLELERSCGFRSGVFFVAERYALSDSWRDWIAEMGCEVGVHGLRHDGMLYRSRAEFQKRAIRIRRYLANWKSVGFRSPSMHHRPDWLHELGLQYDCSTFDVDPFQPQPDGVKTIFPFWVSGHEEDEGYVELPYTLPQDFTLFIELRQKGIDVWKRKLDWIAQNKGIALLITHPDYMDFGDRPHSRRTYPARYYTEFLEYIETRYAGQYWHVLPREMASFWRQTRRMHARAEVNSGEALDVPSGSQAVITGTSVSRGRFNPGSPTAGTGADGLLEPRPRTL